MTKPTILCKLSWWCKWRHDHNYHINIELGDEHKHMMQQAMERCMPDVEEQMKKILARNADEIMQRQTSVRFRHSTINEKDG